MTWFWNNREYVLDLAWTHLWLSVLPIVIGFAIAVPIGWYANRHPRVRELLLGFGSTLYTIPSLALLTMTPLFLGTGFLDPLNVVFALSIYAVALMVRAAADGFASVAPSVLDSSTATGFSAVQRAFTVELPLAGPVLLAGLRVVAVSTVSLVSVGALIGVSNLGLLFTGGFRRDFTTEIVVGVVGVVAIALLLDALLVLGGRLLLPWSVTRTRAVASPRLSFVQHLRGGRV